MHVTNPKPEPYKRVKARKHRHEWTVKKTVHQYVDERDGYCIVIDNLRLGPCAGPSEWAHIGRYRRCHTRGMAPEKRHTTKGSAKLCQKHHRAYDAHEFEIQPMTDLGMDGPTEMGREQSPQTVRLL
jgi:hypothetical protein